MCVLCVCVTLGQGNWDMWYDPLAYFILGGRTETFHTWRLEGGRLRTGHFWALGGCLIDASPMAGMLFCAAMNAVLLNKGLAEFEAMTPALVWSMPCIPECFSCFGGCKSC